MKLKNKSTRNTKTVLMYLNNYLEPYIKLSSSCSKAIFLA